LIETAIVEQGRRERAERDRPRVERPRKPALACTDHRGDGGGGKRCAVHAETRKRPLHGRVPPRPRDRELQLRLVDDEGERRRSGHLDGAHLRHFDPP
jgi:hypothetical protein